MERELAKKIGEAARRARKALGITQEDAADRIGISLEFYSRIERGGTLPSVPTLLRMANALAASADELLGRTETSTFYGVAEPHPAYGEDDSPELRRLVRKLRRARPRTLRIVGLVASELER